MTWHGARLSSTNSDRFIAPIRQFKVTHTTSFIHSFIHSILCFIWFSRSTFGRLRAQTWYIFAIRTTHTPARAILFNIVINKFQIFNTKIVLDFRCFTLMMYNGDNESCAIGEDVTIQSTFTLWHISIFFWFELKWALFDFCFQWRVCVCVCFKHKPK